MKRAITIASVCLGVAAIGAPAATADGDGGHGKSAVAKECHALKKADKAAFRATFGPKHAMRTCKKGAKEDAGKTTPAEFKNAAQECRAEREADAEAFQETYGTNANKRNAFGKCVSGKVKHRPRSRKPRRASAASAGKERPPPDFRRRSCVRGGLSA